MALSKIFGTIIPAQYIGHDGQYWTVAGTLLGLIVNGDQVVFPGGLKLWIRVTAEGHGRLDAVIRVRNYESEEVIHEQTLTIDYPPTGHNPEKSLNTYDLSFCLKLERLYPAVAASSLGVQVQTSFMIEMVVPGNLFDPSITDTGEGVPGAIITMTPLYLTCNPPPTNPTIGTRP